MVDVFISYKREDREFARSLAVAFEQAGYEVWYDFELISGDPFRTVIRNVIDLCAVVVVVWSAKSVDSEFVLDEASHGKAQGKLCPARIDEAPLPYGFGQTHTEDLRGWNGDPAHPGFARLLRSVTAKIGAKPAPSDDLKSRQAELDAFKRAVASKSAKKLQSFVSQNPGSVLLPAAQLAQSERIRRTRLGVLVAAVSALSLFAGLYSAGLLGMAKNGAQPDVPEPLSEQRLKDLVAKSLTLVARGECSEELMTVALFASCNAYLGQMQPAVAALGPILNVVSEGRFPSAASGGEMRTRFLVTYQRGQQRWEVLGSEDGRLATFWTGGR